MGIRTSPTVRRRRLASELRRLRTEAGVRAADVAAELGCSPGKISQMETTRVAISVPDAKAMLELYGVTGERRESLVELARAAKLRGWWMDYGDTVHPWFQHYLGLETEAAGLCVYQSELVPGLLQTEDYQRALLAGDLTRWSAADVETLVAVRARRQEILAGPDPAHFWFVLNEAALRKRVGTAEAMLAQLHRLLEVARRANVNLQVLPFAAGAHVAVTGSFTMLTFADPADPAVAYVEYLTGARYIEDHDEVTRYGRAFTRLTQSALSRTRSVALIREIIRDL